MNFEISVFWKRLHMRYGFMQRLIMRTGTFLAIVVGLLFTTAQAEIRVGKGERYRSVSNALLDAKRGEVVRIIGGEYRFGDLELPYDVKIIGEGEVTFKAARNLRKGILVPINNAAVHVEGITFANAKSPDKNGAGIRFEGARLSVVNCTFMNNENGILATGKSNSTIFIRNANFINNGYGDGYSHGIYMSKGTGLVIENTLFQGTKEGHHVKSLAQETVIRQSKFIDAPGWPSYVVDISKGGNLTFEENEIARSPQASQKTLFNYDTTRGGQRGHVVLAQNIITNAKKGARLIRNPEGVLVQLTDNVFKNIEGGSLAIPKRNISKGNASRRNETANQSYPPDLHFDQPGAFKTKNGISVQDLNRLSPQQRRAVKKLLEARGETPIDTKTGVDALPSGHSTEEYGTENTDIAVIQTSPANKTAPAPGIAPKKGVLEVQTVPGQVRGIVVFPSFKEQSTKEDIVPLNIIRTNSVASPYLTIGQVFKRGDLYPENGVGLRLKKAVYPIQLDAKSFYNDGSIKHAALTLEIPDKAEGKGMIISSLPDENKLMSTQFPAHYAVDVKISGKTGDGATFSTHIPLRSLWQESTKKWLAGTFVEERTGLIKIGPFLKLRADIRLYKDGRVRTHLNFENYLTFKPGNRNLNYAVEIDDGSAVIFKKSVAQHRASSWSKVIWHGGAPAYEVQHDARYLAAAKAVPSFNFTHGISGRLLNELGARVNEKGALSTIVKYFPTSGGRAEIGPLPQWDIAYLKTQNLKAKSIMLAIARAAGDIPWHLEDDKTYGPLRIDLHPSFWNDPRGIKLSHAADRLPESYFASKPGDWELDRSHKPLLTYTAYLVTADVHFARSLAHEAAFVLGATSSQGRAEERGLIALSGQVRARAWSLRDIANAAYILPSNWALTRYFKKIRDANLAALKKRYVTDRIMRTAGEVEGYFTEESYRYPGQIAPWQHDYLFIMIGQEALRGSVDAKALVQWAMKYQIGRVLNGVTHPELAVGYRLATFDPQTKEKYATWAEMGRHNILDKPPGQNRNSAGFGYLASGLAALSVLYEVTGDARARKAYNTLLNAFPKTGLFDPMDKSGVYINPHYDLIPPASISFAGSLRD